MTWTIFNNEGQRKYLTRDELDSFLSAADRRSIAVKTFCAVLALTGCRISEALSLSRNSIDFETGNVIILCLKKRRKRVFRAVPLPSDFLLELKQWFETSGDCDLRMWPWSRMTGYRRICEVMASAGVSGGYATPKGLRHGFAVRAIQAQVPLTLVQRWLGHADIKTTAIYTSVIGPEEREIAARMWAKKQPAERRRSRSRPELADVPDRDENEPLDRLGKVRCNPHAREKPLNQLILVCAEDRNRAVESTQNKVEISISLRPVTELAILSLILTL